MIGSGRVMGHGRELPHAGELLAIEAIDQTGLIVTSEGAFVRIFKVTPPNPLLMSAPEQDKTAAGFQRLVSQLRTEESLQIYIDARPVNLTQLLADCRREVQASAGAGARASERRSDGAGAMAAVRGDGGVAAAARRPAGRRAGLLLRGRAVPPAPERRQGGAGLGSARPAADRRRWSGRCGRIAGRYASSWLTWTHCAQSSRPRACPPSCSTASRSRVCCGRGSTRPRPTTRRRRTTGNVEVLGELDAATDRDLARQAALRLREQIAQSSLDFRASHQHVVVDRDVEQTILVANTAGRTHMGWLHGAMLTRQPFTLQRVRPRARASPRAPTAQARLPPAVHDQSRRRAARTGARLRPLRPGARVPGAARRDGRRRAVQPVQGLDLPDAARPRTRTRTWRRSQKRSTSALSRSSPRATARSAAASSASTSCGPRACRSDATSTAGRASTPPTTPATWSRWSARTAGRRPGSRSRSPTRVAPSSC